MEVDLKKPLAPEVVVVPLDGSAFSARAIPVAQWLADRLGTATRTRLVSMIGTADEMSTRQRELAKSLAGDPNAEAEIVIDGDIVGAIHRLVAPAQGGQAIACVATHGRGRSAALMGSVANGVVNRFRDVAVMVGEQVAADRPSSWTVMACVDDDPSAATVIDVALGWASLLHGNVIVAAAAEPVPESAHGTPTRGFGPQGDVDAYLEKLVSSRRQDGTAIETVVVWDPISPADGVAEYAAKNDVAMVVVGTHSRSGLRRLALGSVAANVVHRSPSPVLVVPTGH